MPISLDNIQASAKTLKSKQFTPKFFSSRLTGVGKKTGVLNMDRNPKIALMNNNHTSVSFAYDALKIKTFKNGMSRVTTIPINLIPSQVLHQTIGVNNTNSHVCATFPTPDVTPLCEIGTMGNAKLYLHMAPSVLGLEEIEQTAGPTQVNLDVMYRLELYCIYDAAFPMTVDYLDKSSLQPKNLMTTSHNHVLIYETNEPIKYMDTIIDTLLNVYPNMTINRTAIADYFLNYDLYASVCDMSETWKAKADKYMDVLFDIYASLLTKGTNPRIVNAILRTQISYLENYGISLPLYKNIYMSLQKSLPSMCGQLCKQNMNLFLFDTLYGLESQKNNLTHLTAPQPAPQTLPASLQKFSNEQRDAITSQSPLILVQAGAGTGKSTVILGRINYMIDCGVNPHDITVLSFTNAAADHITEICPKVNSMTIARMIHSIYELNYSHELSSLDTIVNAIDIYFPKKKNVPVTPLSQVAWDFKGKLYDLIKDAGAYTAVNNFVEEHFDEVIAILDTINQTSLELEIVICYQKIDTLKEPDEIKSKYLIIDEVQDNSVFEFIYALKYTNKHKESLFIVGDCSQTLYEFRASNPKALNILESSGVFEAHRLQINYRSNQEILDFANVILNDIEANQYAQIQLQANSLAPVTAQSFTDKVKLNYVPLAKISEANEMIETQFNGDIKKYIDSKLAIGEKVAILAFTRNTLNSIQDILTKTHPNANVVSLVPKRIYNSTIISSFVKQFWYDATKFASPNQIVNIVQHDILDHLSMLCNNPDKAEPTARKMLQKWRLENEPTINNWYSGYANGTMTKVEFLDLVKDNLIQFEIRENSIKQSLISAANSQNKQNNTTTNANILLSTIHSAKGLEFDNVIVIYRNENALAEDKKRMYYVAFTRAMKSEYVLAYDTVKMPKIETDYDAIVKRLSCTASANKTVAIS